MKFFYSNIVTFDLQVTYQKLFGDTHRFTVFLFVSMSSFRLFICTQLTAYLKKIRGVYYDCSVVHVGEIAHITSYNLCIVPEDKRVQIRKVR